MAGGWLFVLMAVTLCPSLSYVPVSDSYPSVYQNRFLSLLSSVSLLLIVIPPLHDFNSLVLAINMYHLA